MAKPKSQQQRVIDGTREGLNQNQWANDLLNYIVRTGGDVASVLGQMAQGAGRAVGMGAEIAGSGIVDIFNQVTQPTNPIEQDIASARGKITGQGDLMPQQTGGPRMPEGNLIAGDHPAMKSSDGQHQTLLGRGPEGLPRRQPTVGPSGIPAFESQSLNRVVTPQNVGSLSGDEAWALMAELDPGFVQHLSPEIAKSPRGSQMLRQTLMGRFGAME